MEQLSFKGKKGVNPAKLEKHFARFGLKVTMKGVLKSISDNTHWHLKLGKEPGLCEITLMSTSSEIIVSCKKNRQGGWISEYARRLREELER
jgi:hypothetical protein